ncbi:hypothetical protein [Cohnella sp. GCM10012308]|uniref:hypothetical protein n=1 Tax=Cohnella sp. GCM10012308 TaxID=3317329 RepID=UPI00361E6120
MARPNKIEFYELQHIVARCISQGITASRQIAAACTEEARKHGIKEEISHSAVVRYLEANKYEQTRASVSTEKKKEAVVRVEGRVEKLVNYDLDIIDLQLRTTTALYDRFVYVDGLPDMVEGRLAALIEKVMDTEGTDADYLARWKIAFVEEMRRNIAALTQLNRELRENAKFMSELREKAFEFNLVQEYIHLFMQVFRETNAEAFEIAEQRIASNPRLQRIVEQQQQMRGMDQV